MACLDALAHPIQDSTGFRHEQVAGTTGVDTPEDFVDGWQFAEAGL
jgi:hypothetical protein